MSGYGTEEEEENRRNAIWTGIRGGSGSGIGLNLSGIGLGSSSAKSPGSERCRIELEVRVEVVSSPISSLTCVFRRCTCKLVTTRHQHQVGMQQVLQGQGKERVRLLFHYGCASANAPCLQWATKDSSLTRKPSKGGLCLQHLQVSHPRLDLPSYLSRQPLLFPLRLPCHFQSLPLSRSQFPCRHLLSGITTLSSPV